MYRNELFYRKYVQREDAFIHAPYNPEVSFYHSIQTGDEEKVKELCEDPLCDKPGLGRLSTDPLQNLKYHFVITTALAARFCIEGGMPLSTAYSLSDFYIQKADKATSLEEITRLHPVMCLDYTRRMKQQKTRRICSKPVALCIDYIYDNLHARITIDDLAAFAGINKSYLSRIFKKETGTSPAGYIRRQKLETAKNMLAMSNYPVSEISSILAFNNQSHFTYLFHRYTGQTPAQYRKSYFQTGLTHEDIQ